MAREELARSQPTPSFGLDLEDAQDPVAGGDAQMVAVRFNDDARCLS